MNRRTWLWIVVAALAGGIWPPGVRSQTVWYVNGALGTNGNGQTWGTAFNNLQSALDNVTPDRFPLRDQIWVAQSVYKPSVLSNPPDPRSARFTLPSGIEIYGGFAGGENNLNDRRPDLHPTVLSGDIGTPGVPTDNCYCVVFPLQLSVPSLLDGFTIRDGNGGWQVDLKDSGAGMFITGGASPTIANCRFVNNEVVGWELNTGCGAGVCVDNGSPSFTACRFENNRGDYGAALATLSGSANLTVSRCVFVSNTANLQAAALYNARLGTLRVWNSIFLDNRCTSTLHGGTIGQFGVSAEIVNCLLHGNSSIGATIANSYMTEASTSLINTTIAFNQTGCSSALLVDGPATVVNSVFWGNTAGNQPPTEVTQISYLNNPPTVHHSCLQNLDPNGPFYGNNNLGDAAGFDPLFVHANGSNTDNLRLIGPGNAGDGSPLIDAGYNNVVTLGDDLDGTPRIVNNVVDIGAYEYHWLDCNDNGVGDGLDIANCSPQHPEWCGCNGNNIPDGCDITSGFSMDCNHKEC